MSVPPFDGLDLQTRDEHSEMEMITAGHARGAGLADNLPALDRIPLADVDFTQVRIEGLQPETVVQNHHIAVDAHEFGQDDPARVSCGNREATKEARSTPRWV